MDIPAVIDYVIVQTSRGKSKSDYLKSFTGLIDVNLNSFSDILTQINQGTILATEATPKRQPCDFLEFSWEATLKRQPCDFSIFSGNNARETTLAHVEIVNS